MVDGIFRFSKLSSCGCDMSKGYVCRRTTEVQTAFLYLNALKNCDLD